MKPTFLIRLIFFIFLCAVSGCLSRGGTVSKSLEDKFNDEFPVFDMNESLQLKVDADKNVFQKNTKIPLVLNNMSAQNIFFQPDSSLKLLVIRDDEWTEIKNKYSYSGSLQLSAQGTVLLDTHHIIIEPVFEGSLDESNTKDILLVRVLIVGEILEHGAHTGKLVGAHVDVDLKQ